MPLVCAVAKTLVKEGDGVMGAKEDAGLSEEWSSVSPRAKISYNPRVVHPVESRIIHSGFDCKI